jgi:hypothetical protein
MRERVARARIRPSFQTASGKFFVGRCETLLAGPLARPVRGKVQLLLTSPPFPLNRKKKYGNKTGTEFKQWFVNLGEKFAELLTPDGSIVIEMGNGWMPGRPVQSVFHLECLLDLLKKTGPGLRLIQEFICYNPARLPSPAQWVTIDRIRMTDSFTHVWWLSKTDYPKADNRRVLRPYSTTMVSLLKAKRYNHGPRPSEHRVSKKGFLRDHGGSIGHNFVELDPIDPDRPPRLPNVVSLANTSSADRFLIRCRALGINPHPARMPVALANFFISFLTDRGDLVLDPFAGSNTTGYAAEMLGRKWIGIEANSQYVDQAALRFVDMNEPKFGIAAE